MCNEIKPIIDLIISPDHYNACPSDGARTDLVESKDGHTVEACSQCHAIFNFWDD
jgi:hypothetical protein